MRTAIALSEEGLEAQIQIQSSADSTKKVEEKGFDSNSVFISTDLSQCHLVDPSCNITGNYQNYVTAALSSILSVKKAVSALYPKIEMNQCIRLLPSEKKILLLDLDETLIHADFENLSPNHDEIISFNADGNEVFVGIILRPGVFEFLENLRKIFDIYIYTASKKEYADAVVDLLDPENKIFKGRFYRENCLNINNQLFVKDLSIFGEENISKIILIDNSFYSFMNQISNGILVNSFYFDKNDTELLSVMNYLIGYVEKAADVRMINDGFFNFNKILEEIQNSFEEQYY